LKPLQTFSGVEVKRRIVPHKILYNFPLRCKFKFQTEFESQIKTSSRFLNKFILVILYKLISQILELQKFHKNILKSSKTHFNLLCSSQANLKQAC